MTTTLEEAPAPTAPSLLAGTPWPMSHPAEEEHQALLEEIAGHLEAGLLVPCLEAPAESSPWLIEAEGAAATAASRRAAAACDGCPALASCREYALAAPEEGAVWGGTIPKQRATALVARRAAGATNTRRRAA